MNPFLQLQSGGRWAVPAAGPFLVFLVAFIDKVGEGYL
jgi:hypothetical protein